MPLLDCTDACSRAFNCTSLFSLFDLPHAQVLHEKVTDRWNQDPADCGVIFEPTWCGQPQRGPTVICPQCGNGASGNPDFSVTVSDDAVLWHCFRAKCGFEGGVNLVGGLNGNSSAVLDKAGKVLDRLTSSPNTPPTVVAQARHDLQQLRLQVWTTSCGPAHMHVTCPQKMFPCVVVWLQPVVCQAATWGRLIGMEHCLVVCQVLLNALGYHARFCVVKVHLQPDNCWHNPGRL